MQIIAHGIPWSVKLRDEEGNVSIKHGGSGITFVGKPYVHPFWGPYIDAEWVYIKDKPYLYYQDNRRCHIQHATKG